MQLNWLEIKRQLFHLIVGIVLVILLNIDFIDLTILIATLILLIIFSIISKIFQNSFFNWFLDHFDRPVDKSRIPARGAMTYLLGMIIVLSLFKKDIALASILVMVVGDSVSPLVGMHFAKTKHILNEKKLIEGTIAGVIAAFIAASFFVSHLEAILAALIGMFVEIIDFKYFRSSFL